MRLLIGSGLVCNGFWHNSLRGLLICPSLVFYKTARLTFAEIYVYSFKCAVGAHKKMSIHPYTYSNPSPKSHYKFLQEIQTKYI